MADGGDVTDDDGDAGCAMTQDVDSACFEMTPTPGGVLTWQRPAAEPNYSPLSCTPEPAATLELHPDVPCIVGRQSGNHLVLLETDPGDGSGLNQNGLSRHHATLTLQGAGLCVAARGSLSGCLVGGLLLNRGSPPMLLPSGGLVTFGPAQRSLRPSGPADHPS